MRTPSWIMSCSAFPKVSSGLTVAALTWVRSVITHSAGESSVTARHSGTTA
jgi:hypothetical protein